MSSFLLILICLTAGYFLRFTRKLPDTLPKSLNGMVIYLSFPALILAQMPEFLASGQWRGHLLIPGSMAWISILASLAVFGSIGRSRKWDPRLTGALILTAGFGNTSFVGFPLIEAFYGPEGLKTALIVDQVGSFLSLSTIGIMVGAYYSSSETGNLAVQIVRKVVTFPPFLAMCAVILLHLVGFALPQVLHEALARLGATLVPLALVSVGFQLRASREVLRRKWSALSMGLAYKLVLAPLALAFLYMGVFGSRSQDTRITLIEAAMAPMITAAIIAEDFELDSELCGLMVGIGIPLSLITVPIWWWLIG